MKDKLYPQLRKRLDDIYSVSPNDLYYSPLTSFFKFLTSYLKFFPFKLIIPLAIAASIGLYILLGFFVVRLASILQHGF